MQLELGGRRGGANLKEVAMSAAELKAITDKFASVSEEFDRVIEQGIDWNDAESMERADRLESELNEIALMWGDLSRKLRNTR